MDHDLESLQQVQSRKIQGMEADIDALSAQLSAVRALCLSLFFSFNFLRSLTAAPPPCAQEKSMRGLSPVSAGRTRSGSTNGSVRPRRSHT